MAEQLDLTPTEVAITSNVDFHWGLDGPTVRTIEYAMAKEITSADLEGPKVPVTVRRRIRVTGARVSLRFRDGAWVADLTDVDLHGYRINQDGRVGELRDSGGYDEALMSALIVRALAEVDGRMAPTEMPSEAPVPAAVPEEAPMLNLAQRQAEALRCHNQDHSVQLALLVGSPVEFRHFVSGKGYVDLGRLLLADDYGHDRSLRFQFEHAVKYFDRATTSQFGSITEPAFAGWASD